MDATTKTKTLEYRHMCDCRTVPCEFCGEEDLGAIHAYICRETGTGNYRDYVVFAHPGCFLAYSKAEFDDAHAERGL